MSAHDPTRGGSLAHAVKAAHISPSKRVVDKPVAQSLERWFDMSVRIKITLSSLNWTTWLKLIGVKLSTRDIAKLELWY